MTDAPTLTPGRVRYLRGLKDDLKRKASDADEEMRSWEARRDRALLRTYEIDRELAGGPRCKEEEM